MKHEIVPAITVHVLDVTAMGRTGTASIRHDVRRSEAIAHVLTGWVELICLEDSHGGYSPAIQLNRILITAGLDVDLEA
jgi:hypothetical protein